MTTLRPYKARGLLGNGMALLAMSYMTSLLGYVFWVLCARSVSPAAIGVANAVIAAMTLVAILSVAGLLPLLVRLLPGADPDERSGLCSTAFAMAAAVAGALGGVGALLLPDRLHDAVGTRWLVVLLIIGAMATALTLVNNAALLGVRRAELSLLGSVVGSVARLGAVAATLTVGVVAAGSPVGATHTILVVWVASVMLSLVLSMWSLSRATPNFRFRPGRVWLTRLRQSAGWDHVATLAVRAPTFVIPVLAAAVLPPAQLGYLAVTAMIGTVFFAVAAAISNALLADCAGDPARLGAQARRASQLIALLLFTPVLITCLFAREVLSIFGAGYADYSVALILLLLATFPDALINVSMTILRIRHRLRIIAVLTVVGAAISIGGAWLLMPSLGIFGAAVAVLTAQLVMAAAFAVVGPHRFVLGASGITVEAPSAGVVEEVLDGPRCTRDAT